jgi:hypothetical protein
MERKAFSDCLFQVERRLLTAIISSLFNLNYRVDAKIHDGCNVRKPPGVDEMPSEVIRQVEADVLTETGFDVKLKVKPFIITSRPPEIIPSNEVAQLNRRLDSRLLANM